jgi:translation elongation factor EF-G
MRGASTYIEKSLWVYSEDVARSSRNILGILPHVDAGKTMLTERPLY